MEQDPVGQGSLEDSDHNNESTEQSSKFPEKEDSSIGALLVALTAEVKNKFKVSELNQKEIRNACKILEKKIDDLNSRTTTLEVEVNGLRETVQANGAQIEKLNIREREQQDRVEILENFSRRNNIKILTIPEGREGENGKAYMVQLIKRELQLEETEQEIAKDLQRVHRDPFRLNANRSKPTKILLNFLTYSLKEKILSKALSMKSIEADGARYEFRSDVSSATSNRQWELGKRIDSLKNCAPWYSSDFQLFLK